MRAPEWIPTLTERRELRRLFAEGRTDPELCAHFSRSPEQIRQLRRDERLLRPHYRGGGPKAAWTASIPDLVAAGCTDEAIGRLFDRSAATVRHHRQIAGIKRPNVKPRPPIEVRPLPPSRGKPIEPRHAALMLAARRAGWGWRKIGRQWKIAPYRVQREVTRYERSLNA